MMVKMNISISVQIKVLLISTDMIETINPVITTKELITLMII